jgi:transmembrane sensor
MNQHIYKQTFFALFEGRATLPQKALLTDFLSDPSNLETYYLWLEEWELQNPQLVTNQEEAYLKVTERAFSSQHIVAPISKISSYWRAIMAQAACLMLVCFALAYYFRDSLLNKRYSTTYGELKTIVLPEGTKVLLNANSTLTVPRFGFGKGARGVMLNGEAEFSVRHLPNNQRFIVRTPDQLEVQVLGTVFNVYSRQKGSKVVLNEGKVQMRSLKKMHNKPIIINPGDVVTVSKQGDMSLRHYESLAAFNGWKDHRFSFENTTVSDIATELNNLYGVQLIIPDSSLAKRTLGGTFQAHDAESFLNVIADILGVRVVSQGNQPRTYTLTY